MPLESIAWKSGIGADYHLVPGLASPELARLLTIRDGGATFDATAPPGHLTVTWSVRFASGDPGCGGVTVDTGTAATGSTGEVQVAGPLSAPPRLQEFLVLATVQEGANPPLRAYVRVMVHERIVRTWLTPSPLTVRFGTDHVRFSVLAEFDHGVVGDISNWSPWTFDPADPDDLLTCVRTLAGNLPVFDWASDSPPDLDVDPVTGVLFSLSDATSVTITATCGIAGGDAVGTAAGAPGWDAGAVVEPIAGPGFAAVGSVPSILVLGDGFAQTERPAFIRHVRQVVDDLHRDGRLQPYPWLKGRINWFAAMLDSPQPGVTTLNPIDRAPIGGGTLADAKDVDTAVAPAAAPGLAPVIGVPAVNATRYVLNERDTAFATALGERPRAQRSHQIRTAHLLDRRFSEDDFDTFLQSLEKPDGTPVNGHWHRSASDQTSIVILLRTSHFGGANRSRTAVPGTPSDGHIICGALGRKHTYRIDQAAGGQGHDIVPDAIPATPETVLRLRFAHELGHSFTLGDEYGGGASLPASEVTAAGKYANVQPRSRVVDAGGVLDATKITWAKWPRIEKAGVLAAAVPGGVGATFVVQLEPGHAKPFAVNDVVRLRTRPLPLSVQSGRFEVVSKPSDSELELRTLGAYAGGTAAGSIVIVPKRAPDVGGALGDDLSLVHARVIDHMQNAGRRNPLNAAFNSPQDRPCPGGEPVYPFSTPALNFGPGNAPNPPHESAWIAGLWERGDGFNCDVYHPTGACIMNVYSYDGYVSSFQFCWICRYAIVDFIDPTLHGKVDRSYASRYPT